MLKNLKLAQNNYLFYIFGIFHQTGANDTQGFFIKIVYVQGGLGFLRAQRTNKGSLGDIYVILKNKSYPVFTWSHYQNYNIWPKCLRQCKTLGHLQAFEYASLSASLP